MGDKRGICYYRSSDRLDNNNFGGHVLNVIHSLSKYPKYEKLLQYIQDEKKKQEIHEEDVVWDFYEREMSEVYLDINFAEKLQLYDIVSPFCFSSTTEVGKTMIAVLEGLVFIVYQRKIIKEGIRISFLVCEEDWEDEVFEQLIKESHCSQ